MKKLFITLALAAATFVGANAQFFVGGNVGFALQSENTGGTFSIPGTNLTNTGDFTDWSLFVNPRVGYSLDEKMSVGAYISLGYEQAKLDNPAPIGEVKAGAFTWGVAPFFRYNVVSFGKFGIAAEAKLGVGGAVYNIKDVDAKPTEFNFGIGVTPYLTYGLNDHWELETGLNFLTLGYSFSQLDYDVAGIDKEKSHLFGIGVNANNIATLGAITIGATYKF